MLVANVLSEVALELGAVRAERTLKLRLHAAFIAQMAHKSVLPHVAPATFWALVRLGYILGRTRARGTWWTS